MSADVGAEAVGIAIIGAGRIGKLHAENLHSLPGARIVGIADVVPEAARAVAQALGIGRVEREGEALIEDRAVDAVLICSNTDSHSRYIRAAARAGKQIFCEKPIALDVAEIDRTLQAVEEAGVKLQIGFNRRFDANFRRLFEHRQGGAIGTPHLLRIASRDPAPPPIDYLRGSGGIFVDMMIHDFDMARWLMGREVVELYALGGALIDPAIGEMGDIDTAIVTLRFDGGALGVIDNSRQAVYGYDQRVEIFGSAGMATASNNHATTVTLSTAESVCGDLPLNFFMQRYADAYRAEMEAFLRCIREDTPPPVTGADGRMPVVMGLAAGLSLREHRPVSLREIDGLR